MKYMQLKILFKWPFFIVGIIFIILLSITLFFLLNINQVLSKNNTVSLQQLNLPNPQAITPLPVRLKIPKIKIDAPVDYVGLTPEGGVGVPKGPATVAWLNLSPPPGAIGNSIIDGHAGYKNNIPAVFDNLYKLRKGDKIYIEDDKGETIVFVVREIKKYKPKTNPLNVFSSSDGLSHLNLITCTGAWDAKNKTHSERLVVFTDRQ